MSELTFVTGKVALPHRYLIYGTPGIGKTTFAASTDSPVWIDCEDGSGDIDVPRYQFAEGRHVPRNYVEVITALEKLAMSKHGRKTVVIDTVDRLESLIHAHICTRDKKTNIEDYGYGKGYVMALSEWREVANKLNALRAAGMTVVVLGHAVSKTWKNPEGDDYDRYTVAVDPKAAKFLYEWADNVWFARFEEGGAKVPGAGPRPKGYMTGRRIMHTERGAAFDAKKRVNIAAEVEFDVKLWKTLQGGK